MPLERIDHYLLQTTDLTATRDWYVQAAAGIKPELTASEL
jgi:hypothetical protein